MSTLKAKNIQHPSASTTNLQLGSSTVTIPSGVTVDINAGAIDNTIIGGSTAAAGTFTTVSGTLADGVTATTQASSDNTTKVATTAYVKSVATLEDLDIAGDTGTGAVDLDSQSLTVAGTTNEIVTVASGQTVTVSLPATINADTTGTATNATNAAHVQVTDNESTNESNLITFVENAQTSSGNQGLEMDGNLTYNPSTGTVSATAFSGNGSSITSLNGSNISSGTVAAARVATLNQSTTGSAATLTTGRTISTTGDVTYTSSSFNGSGNATGTATIANDAVTTSKILNSNVTDAKISALSSSKLTGQVPDSNLSMAYDIGGAEASECKYYRRAVWMPNATTATSVFSIVFNASYTSSAWIKVTAINRKVGAYTHPSVVTKEFLAHKYTAGSGAGTSGSTTTPTQSTPFVFTTSWDSNTYTFKFHMDTTISSVPGSEVTCDSLLIFDIAVMHKPGNGSLPALTWS